MKYRIIKSEYIGEYEKNTVYYPQVKKFLFWKYIGPKLKLTIDKYLAFEASIEEALEKIQQYANKLNGDTPKDKKIESIIPISCDEEGNLFISKQ